MAAGEVLLLLLLLLLYLSRSHDWEARGVRLRKAEDRLLWRQRLRDCKEEEDDGDCHSRREKEKMRRIQMMSFYEVTNDREEGTTTTTTTTRRMAESEFQYCSSGIAVCGYRYTRLRFSPATVTFPECDENSKGGSPKKEPMHMHRSCDSESRAGHKPEKNARTRTNLQNVRESKAGKDNKYRSCLA